MNDEELMLSNFRESFICLLFPPQSSFFNRLLNEDAVTETFQFHICVLLYILQNDGNYQ